MDGYAHHHLRVRRQGREALVRIRTNGAHAMDQAAWPESAILEVVDRLCLPAPRFLGYEPQTGFLVIEHISGAPLERSHPRSTPLPQGVLGAVAGLLDQLAAVPTSDLPSPQPTSCRDAFGAGLAHTESLLERYAPDAVRAFDAFDVSRAHVEELRIESSEIDERPLSFCHGDLNRSNILYDGEHAWFIDWELARVSDPVFDVAVHLHRAGLVAQDRTALLDALPQTRVCATALALHLRHERLRSLLVDSVRYQQRGLAFPDLQQPLSARLAAKLDEAGHGPWTADAVADVLYGS